MSRPRRRPESNWCSNAERFDPVRNPEQLLHDLAGAADDFREQVIRHMYEDGFPRRESAALCDQLVRYIRWKEGR